MDTDYKLPQAFAERVQLAESVGHDSLGIDDDIQALMHLSDAVQERFLQHKNLLDLDDWAYAIATVAQKSDEADVETGEWLDSEREKIHYACMLLIKHISNAVMVKAMQGQSSPKFDRLESLLRRTFLKGKRWG